MNFIESSAAKLCGLVLVAALVGGCGGGGGKSSSNASASSGNAAPTITGQPGTSVLAGQSYTFQPSASDANGDALTFTATNLPAWATLNASTGRVSGTPTAAQIGSYAGITIRVSDGQASTALSAFTINVTDTATGSATLSWVPPTQNSDGSSLSTLTGFQVWYGQSADDLSQVVNLDNPSINRYVVENLSAGTWYFSVAAVSTGGSTSDRSNVASKTIS